MKKALRETQTVHAVVPYPDSDVKNIRIVNTYNYIEGAEVT